MWPRKVNYFQKNTCWRYIFFPWKTAMLHRLNIKSEVCVRTQATYPSSLHLRGQHDHHGGSLFPRHLPEVGASVGQRALARYVAVDQAGGRNLHLQEARYTQWRAKLRNAARFLQGRIRFSIFIQFLSVKTKKPQGSLLSGGNNVERLCFSLVFRELTGSLSGYRGKHFEDNSLLTKTINRWQSKKHKNVKLSLIGSANDSLSSTQPREGSTTGGCEIKHIKSQMTHSL